MSAANDPASDPASGRDTEGARPGRVAAIYADRCLVWSEGQEVICSLRGRMKEGLKPVVGDRVTWLPNADGSGTVSEVLARSNELSRTLADRKRTNKSLAGQVLAANVDRMVVVASVRRPPLRAGLLDRFLAAARRAGIPPLICITKLDLAGAGELAALEDIYIPLGIPVLGTDIHRQETIAALAETLRDATSVLVGHSGVGKTSLLNLLTGLDMNVREVGFHTDRGRHTTSTAQLFPLRAGGFAIDSPGIREFGLHGVAPAELAPLFPEFAPLLGQCRFADCLHDSEPGCAVSAAVEAGTVHPARYASYLKLLEEVSRRAQAAEPT